MRRVAVVVFVANHDAATRAHLVVLQAEGEGGLRGEVVFEDAVEGATVLFGAVLPVAAVVVGGDTASAQAAVTVECAAAVQHGADVAPVAAARFDAGAGFARRAFAREF